MTGRTLACCISLALLAGTGAAFGAGTKAAGMREKPAAKAAKKPELVEKTGLIEVRKADAEKHEKYNTVLLKAGAETYKLIPGQGTKKTFKDIEKLEGKSVAVKGELLPPKPPKYPLPAIKVDSFAEAAAPAPTPGAK